jgi:hypothetical protein
LLDGALVRRARRILGIGLVAGAALARAGAAGEAPGVDWRRVAGPGTRGDALAVAAGQAGEPIAVADAEGVWLRRGGRWQRSDVRGAVRDLAIGADGAVWIAGERGLLRLDPSGRVEDRSPGAGARDRDLARVAAAGGVVAAAGAGGVFVGPQAGPLSAVRDGLPAGAVDAIALENRGPEGEDLELWSSVGGQLWRIPLAPDGAPREGAAPERVPLGGPGAGSALVDLAVDVDGRLIALGADWAAREGAPGEAWRAHALRLPPGADARRLVAAGGWLWLATDRGLLHASGLEEGFERAAPPLGGAAASDVAAAGDALLAATEDGLFEASRRAAAASGPYAGNGHVVWDPRPGEPSVQTVQRAALAYLDLGPGRMRALHRRVTWRGWLPTVELEAGRGLVRGLQRDRDQVISSGLLHDLSDSSYDRSSDSEVALNLTWELGDAVFHPDAIDVSKEAREVIELRDDVLDEITQLYFERRRVLLQLAALGTDAGEEAARLRLRADELAAGLDAWTGGWFSGQASPLAPRSPRPVRDTKE